MRAGDMRTTLDVRTDPYLIVSADSHASPPLEDLRPYCPKPYLDRFDDFAREARESEYHGLDDNFGKREGLHLEAGPQGLSAEALREGQATMRRIVSNPGSYDARARLADMDDEGITAELIFNGALNGHDLPWMGSTGFDAGTATVDRDLRAVAHHLWNAWLADFCTAAPERLLGTIQVPIWDIDATIAEIRWGAEHGLRAINLPAPRTDYPSFNNEVYDPLWTAVDELGLPLVTHGGSGERSGYIGRGQMLLWLSEVVWFSRRGLAQMIFGGVFDRHPSLRLMFVEQRGNWVRQTLDELDSAYRGVPRNSAVPLMGGIVEAPARTPSDYWSTNCVVADSFMARFEADMRHDIGLNNLMWGRDYPHPEGTWPRTNAALRHTFAGIPEPEVRTVLETNGIEVFGLDTKVLRPVAERIGPRPSELDKALSDSEFPAFRGLAFRERGSFD
jgi:predicted TIM-barrel fold metal-dependent hydrolase